MPEVFINYRTGDGETAAGLLDLHLSAVFGPDHVFLAHRSIPSGDPFPRALLAGVRRSAVLLAVIGPRWLTFRGSDGKNALNDRKDWIRREIVEAFRCQIRVIPVLLEQTGRLALADLPKALAPVASVQYRRLRHRDRSSDLALIEHDLAEAVPELGRIVREKAQSGGTVPETQAAHSQANSYGEGQSGGVGAIAGDVSGIIGMSGDINGIGMVSGGIGTVVDRPVGPVNTGRGSQFNGPVGTDAFRHAVTRDEDGTDEGVSR